MALGCTQPCVSHCFPLPAGNWGGHNHNPPRCAQALALNNERFMVPEALFRPSDIGLQQAGVAEVVQQAVAALHPALQPLMYSNVLLTGGARLSASVTFVLLDWIFL